LIKVKKYPPTFSRTNLPLPQIDFRRDTKGDREKSWMILQQTHREALQCYYLVVTHLLDRIQGISLVDIRESLMYDYHFDNKLIDQAVDFLLQSDQVDIEEATKTVNRSVLYKAPRITVSVVGEFSPYVPTRLKGA
jgi:hypothetical protein